MRVFCFFLISMVYKIVVMAGLKLTIHNILCFQNDIKKIKLAEKAIREEYMVIPEMYTFFIRNVTDSEDGKVIVTLKGAYDYYAALTAEKLLATPSSVLCSVPLLEHILPESG